MALFLRYSSLACFICCSTFSVLTHADSYSVYSDAYLSGRLSSYEVTPVLGLQKFDPSLGDLTGVTIEAEYGYHFDVSLFSTVLDLNLPHSIAADIYFTMRLSMPGQSGLN